MRLCLCLAATALQIDLAFPYDPEAGTGRGKILFQLIKVTRTSAQASRVIGDDFMDGRARDRLAKRLKLRAVEHGTRRTRIYEYICHLEATLLGILATAPRPVRQGAGQLARLLPRARRWRFVATAFSL
jgi:hypothetical protein